MRVRVTFTVDVNDDIRREINRWYGRPGLATREQVRSWYEANGRSMDDDLSMLTDQSDEGNPDD